MIPSPSTAQCVDAQFTKSLPLWRPEAADGLPQACFLGRSNVGKSSLLNCLVNRKNLARTSKTPGRTQGLNVFDVRLRSGGEERRVAFVDLPGYGYAKAPREVREAWRPMMSSYLDGNADLRAAVLLLDIRHAPTKADLEALEVLVELEAPIVPVATKADKLGANQRKKRQREIANALGGDPDDVRLVSSVTRMGREELLFELFDLCAPGAA